MWCGRPGISLVLSTAASCGLSSIFLPSSDTEVSLLLGELVQLLSHRKQSTVSHSETSDRSWTLWAPVSSTSLTLLFLPAPPCSHFPVSSAQAFCAPPSCTKGSHAGSYQMSIICCRARQRNSPEPGNEQTLLLTQGSLKRELSPSPCCLHREPARQGSRWAEPLQCWHLLPVPCGQCEESPNNRSGLRAPPQLTYCWGWQETNP